MKKKVVNVAVAAIVAIVSFTVLAFFFPKAPAVLKPSQNLNQQSNTKEVIEYVAIGDSLTEGIGDLTNQGGFVPLVANDLKDRYALNAIETSNFGKSGDRSDQILKRINKDEDIRKKLGDADFITLTVGGNDLMKVIQNNLFGLTIDSFTKPMTNYQKQVTELFEAIRKENPDCPIYVLGIYNPFYLNFPEIEDMQTVVDNWNEATEEIVQQQTNSYFIPINDLLYKGLDNEVGVTSEGTEDSTNQSADDLNTVKNNVLYDEDHFHPNNLGYQLMASAVRDELIKTQDAWLIKETSE